jgi:hypothetical protein
MVGRARDTAASPRPLGSRATQTAIGLVELEGVAVTPAVRRWLTQYAQQQISQRELIAKIEVEVAALIQRPSEKTRPACL